jgi:hypothetical protein
MRKNSNIICDSYLTLTAASAHYQDNWICDETLFRLLNAHYPHLKKAFNFTWGASKAVYHRYPLVCNKGKANFDSLFAKMHLEGPPHNG